MPALALDIGTYTIKAISGKPGAKPDVTRVVESFNTLGVTIPGDDAQLEKMVKQLEVFIADNNLPVTDVRLALPETVVSTKVINLPPLNDAELASAIHWQAEQYIPIPPEELSLEYHVIARPARGERNAMMKVLLVGARKSVVEKFLAGITLIGIEPSLLETQILAVLRALQFEKADPSTLVVHIGASTMDMAMMHEGELQFVISHVSGGQMLTRALEQGIGLDAAQAEKYKRTYGLDDAQFQGKIKQALMPSLKVLVNEIAKSVRFFTSQSPTQSVKRILLSGGTAQLPGLVQYVTAELGTEVLVAAPFAQATGNIPTANHSSLTVCMGLLMREL